MLAGGDLEERFCKCERCVETADNTQEGNSGQTVPHFPEVPEGLRFMFSH